MSIQLKFGNCLNELLSIRGWSASQLAKVLKIDSSYVRRWVRGERIPALNSNYLNQIVAALCEGLEKDYKKTTKAALEGVIEKMQGSLDKDNSTSIQEMMQSILHKSQVYSLTLDKELRRSVKPANQQNPVNELLEDSYRRSTRNTFPSNDPVDSFHIAPIPMVLHGREAILSAAISLLNGAIEDNNTEIGGELFLTFQSERGYFADFPELHQYWQQTIVRALTAGWRIKQLCKLNKNVDRSLQLISQIMDWTNYKGTYDLYYFNKYGIINPPYEIILIKGKGAILSYATENQNEVDAGLYLDESKAVDVIAKFANQLFLHVEPLVKILTLNEYFELNTDKSRKPGNHLICFHELSFLTVPFDIMEKYLQISIPDENDRSIHLKRIQDCLQSFERNVKGYNMRHIYPMRAIEHLVRTGSYYRNSYFRPNRDDVIAHLKHIIWLLKTYNLFEIALVSENQFVLLNQAEWEVKGDHTIMLGIMPKNVKDVNVELLAIMEGTSVNAFQQYFEDIWDRIYPLHRDKPFVISWFENLLVHLN